jgi:hypothetical protein
MDLKAPELAEAATTTLQKLGRNALSARLIYRSLELDPYQSQALLMLSEFYRGKTRPVGDEIFAGIIIEYAIDPKSSLSTEQKRLFDKARIEIMNLWGFVTPRAGEFDIDFLGYMSFISELAGRVGSVSNGFRTALAKLGVHAGILDPAKGGATSTYKDWLRSDAAALQR